MNPEDVWDQYAAKFGNDTAVQKLGDRPAATQPVGMVEGIGRSVLQGATFGTSDEAAAGMTGAAAGAKRLLTGDGPTASEAYTAERDRERQRMGAFQKDHPWISGAAELAGGVAGVFAGAPLLGAAKGVLTGAPAIVEAAPVVASATERGILRSAGRGAVQATKVAVPLSALAGAGTAEGGVIPRAKGAAAGAERALETAPFLGGIGGAIAGGTGMLLDKAGARPVSDVSLPARVGVESAEGRAARHTLLGMAGDHVTPQDAIAMSASAAKPVAIADVGPPGGELATMLERAPGLRGAQVGAINKTLVARKAGEVGRVATDLRETSGLPLEHATQTAEQIRTTRAATAKPLYEKAYAQGEINDPEINKLLQTPAAAKAFARAKDIAANEQDPTFSKWATGSGFANVASAQGVPADKVAQIPNAAPTVKILDYIKQGLDDELYALRNAEGGLKSKGARSIQQVRGQLLDRMDALAPDYKAARDAYAGKSALLNALAEGQDHYKADPRDAALALKGMGPSEQEMYRRGAIDQKLAEAGKASDASSVADQFVGSPTLRRQTSLLFNTPQAADEFVSRMTQEQRLAQTKGPSVNTETLPGGERKGLRSPTFFSMLRRVVSEPDPRFAGKVSGAQADLLTAGADNPQDIESSVAKLAAYRKRATQRGGIGQAIMSGVYRQPGLHSGG